MTDGFRATEEEGKPVTGPVTTKGRQLYVPLAERSPWGNTEHKSQHSSQLPSETDKLGITLPF